MAREIVNIGTTANDRTGDSLRDAGGKINRNFAQVFEALGGDSSTLASSVTFSTSGVVFSGLNFDTTLNATEGSSNITITLPDSDGTVVTTTGTQTLTNKILVGATINNPTFSSLSFNDADSSHQYNLVPSNLTADRNITIPTLTADDTFAFTSLQQTLSNKTLASPKITTAIFDTNGAELIKASPTASAVNEITVANASTTNNPSIAATGNDTNISVDILPKGTGAVALGKVAYSSKQVGAGDSDTTTDTVIIGNPSTSLSISLDDGTVDGEYKILINRGTGSFLVNQSGTNFSLPGGATTITLSTNGSAQLVWSGGGVSKWFMIGAPDSADSLVSLS